MALENHATVGGCVYITEIQHTDNMKHFILMCIN
jgi:hypothetical protein